jgi:hypoxanthine phosphoribosyltransferase
MIYVDHVLSEVLIDEVTLHRRVTELGAQISRDYAGITDLLLICILKGGVVFLTDLMREISVPHSIDFMAVSSYGEHARESTGVVRIDYDLRHEIAGRTLLIVEDIVDSGYTLSYIKQILSARRPASIKICTLLSKPSRRKIDLPLDYVGFEIEDKFVFGYGLDLDEKYRNMPFIGVVRQGT